MKDLLHPLGQAVLPTRPVLALSHTQSHGVTPDWSGQTPFAPVDPPDFETRVLDSDSVSKGQALRVIGGIKHPLAALIPHPLLPGREGELEEFRTPRPLGEGQG